MQYPLDSAGGIMTTDYTALPAEMTVPRSLEELRKMSESYFIQFQRAVSGFFTITR